MVRDCISVRSPGEDFDQLFSSFLRSIKIFILDEADEMLSRGFKDQIYDVFRYMNDTIQVSFISAVKDMLFESNYR